MPQTELEPLKQELFAYLESLPEETRTLLRTRTTVSEAGFDTHLNELYGGSWIRATEDFQFYQFVKTAQRYQRAKSPTTRQRQEKRLLMSAFDIAGLSEEKLLSAIFGEKKEYTTLLEDIKTYITENPPIYDVTYRSGLITILRPGQGTGPLPSYKLLKDQVEEVLSTLTDKEREVLRLRFGLEDGRSRTLEEVSQQYTATPEEIRRIEEIALRKLRHPSRSRKLRDFLE